MAKILFISEKNIKENSIIETGVDSKIIRNSLLEVQSLELMPIIGRKKYEELESAITESSIDKNYVFNTELKELLDDYIAPFLIYGTLAFSFVPVHFKFTNKGINKKTDTNSQTSSKDELEYVKNSYDTKFDSYRYRLINHLKTTTNVTVDSTKYSTGIYLPDSGRNWAQMLEDRAYKIR